ncbi:MAG: hypothetical protein KJO54_05105 [Gammaproteobacteria bacterium]|nr:hypothetical protein [Gammaproteobacteria bacterium]
MSDKMSVKPLSLAVGAALAASMAVGAAAKADASPFSMTTLSSGYMVDVGEGKCGEGKCGGDKGHDRKDKNKGDCEGKCGGDKHAEGKCGGDKDAEGKCGEGKCGGSA